MNYNLVKNLFGFQFAMLFLLGGLMQLVGLGSNTQITVALASLSAAFVIIRMCVRSRLPKSGIVIWGVLASTSIMLSSLAGADQDRYALASILIWVLVPVATFSFMSIAAKSIGYESVLRLLLLVSLVQLPVMFLQRTLYSHISALSPVSIDEVDVAFGTFFLKSDHAVGFLMLCLIVAVACGKCGQLSAAKKIFLLSWWSVTILATNSNISHYLLFGLAPAFAYRYFYRRAGGYGRAGIFALLAGACSVGGLLIWGSLLAEVHQAYLASGISVASSGESVARLSMLLKFVNEPVRLLGAGAFSYYNPITKEWALFGGHSQLYSVYYDFGLTGLCCFGSLIWVVKKGVRPVTFDFVLYVGFFLAYCGVALPYGDLGMLFTFFFFTSWRAWSSRVPIASPLASRAVAGAVGSGY